MRIKSKHVVVEERVGRAGGTAVQLLFLFKML